MNKGFSVLKFTSLLLIFICLALIFIDQRLEAKNYQQRLNTLKSELEMIDFQKRDLMLKINKEQSRVLGYSITSNAVPVTMKDIIIVPIGKPGDREINPQIIETNSIDQFISFLFNR